MQTGLYDTGWSDEKKCRGCNREKKHREAQALPLSVMEGSWEPDPKRTGDIGSNGPTRRRRVGSGNMESRRTPLSEGDWRKSHVSVQWWESDKQRSWRRSAEGFRDHRHHRWLSVASLRAGGVLAGGRRCRLITRKWRLMHGMYETLDAELEVQRTTKTAELTAFLCLFRRIFGPITGRVEQQREH